VNDTNCCFPDPHFANGADLLHPCVRSLEFLANHCGKQLHPKANHIIINPVINLTIDYSRRSKDYSRTTDLHLLLLQTPYAPQEFGKLHRLGMATKSDSQATPFRRK
jgi:hypothetical protein